MTIHKLKIGFKWLDEIVSGEKTFEVRENDRGYQVGDLLEFVDDRYSPDRICKYRFRVKYILEDFPIALKKDYCILGIEPAWGPTYARGKE